MSTRPTPYGMFAAVGLAEPGAATDLTDRRARARTRTRPDMAWLLGFVAALEERPGDPARPARLPRQHRPRGSMPAGCSSPSARRLPAAANPARQSRSAPLGLVLRALRARALAVRVGTVWRRRSLPARCRRRPSGSLEGAVAADAADQRAAAAADLHRARPATWRIGWTAPLPRPGRGGRAGAPPRRDGEWDAASGRPRRRPATGGSWNTPGRSTPVPIPRRFRWTPRCRSAAGSATVVVEDGGAGRGAAAPAQRRRRRVRAGGVPVRVRGALRDRARGAAARASRPGAAVSARRVRAMAGAGADRCPAPAATGCCGSSRSRRCATGGWRSSWTSMAIEALPGVRSRHRTRFPRSLDLAVFVLASDPAEIDAGDFGLLVGPESRRPGGRPQPRPLRRPPRSGGGAALAAALAPRSVTIPAASTPSSCISLAAPVGQRDDPAARRRGYEIALGTIPERRRRSA